jgi:hypothetical protein
MDGVSSVDRQVFGSQQWRNVAMFLVLLAFALLLPVAALFGYWPAGHVLVAVVPVVLLALAVWMVRSGGLRTVRVEFDSTGLAVVHGRRRFALPWSEVRSVGVVRESAPDVPQSVLVAWPSTEPAPGSYEPATLRQFVLARPGSFAPAGYDPSLRGFILVGRGQLPATDEQLAAAVEQYAPGRWERPVA